MPTLRPCLPVLALLVANATFAQTCTAPAGTDMPSAPSIAPERHAQLSHTETMTIKVPLKVFQDWFFKAPLESLLPGTAQVPAVVGTAAIGHPAFPAPNATRYVCLADGSGAVERVIELQPERFTYVVWGYTLPEAQALLYGHGQFEFSESGAATVLRWTYSFRLKDDRFPGWLGPIGRALFRMSFLDSKYAEFMKTGLKAIKQGAEQAAARAPA